jgi:ACT domain-containing protein
MSGSQEEKHTHTIRLELIDEPGELLRALKPIAESRGNLLSIFHERGNVTPRGHIPIEVDVEATPDRFEDIVESLRSEGINVVQAGAERYSESVIVILSGHIVNTDLSDTLSRIQDETDASVTDLSLSAPEGTEHVSSARVRLATAADETNTTINVIREIATEKDLRVIEPLVSEGGF